MAVIENKFMNTLIKFITNKDKGNYIFKNMIYYGTAVSGIKPNPHSGHNFMYHNIFYCILSTSKKLTPFAALTTGLLNHSPDNIGMGTRVHDGMTMRT